MKTVPIVLLLVGALALAGCASRSPPPTSTPTEASSTPTPTQGNVALNGAGATFPYPLLSKWGSEYNKLTGNQINYQSIGSGGGIKALTDKTVDFAASDAPLTEAQRTAAPGAVHIPEAIGAVVLAYNLPDVKMPLKLTGPVVAGIFMGTIAKWNDPALAALNPGVALPDTQIFTVHRSDGSGTTFVFTDYLTKVSPEWAAGPGKGTSVKWPNAAQQIGAKGNEGVAGVVQGNPNSIGYVELAYATLQKLSFADVKSADGEFVTASLQSASAATDSIANSLPAGDASWTNVSATNAHGAGVYPISSFTYLLVYKDLSGALGSKMDATRAKALGDFLWWAVHDGQQFNEGLQYAKLPASVVKLDEQTIRSVAYNGQPIHG